MHEPDTIDADPWNGPGTFSCSSARSSCCAGETHGAGSERRGAPDMITLPSFSTPDSARA